MLGLNLPTLISRIIILVIAFTFHEFFHAWVAYKFGDNTAKNAGRLTLNPIVHLDPLGSILLLVAGFGWAKPVPINPYQIQKQHPAGVMWVSLAGPLSNFLLAAIAAIPLRFAWVPYASSGAILPSPYQFLVEFIIINLMLMLFNLLPFAPLDGEAIAANLLPSSWSRAMDRIRPYSSYILLIIVFVLPMVGFDLLGMIIRPVLSSLFLVLVG